MIRPDPLEVLRSPEGAIGLGVTALLGVLGLRLMGAALGTERPWRTTIAAMTWASGLTFVWAGGYRLLPGATPPAPVPWRVVGLALLVVGLAIASRHGRGTPGWRSPAVRLAAGLSLVLAGQLVRLPSTGGAIAVAVALAGLWQAAAGAAGGPPTTPERPHH
jgi:hypothetical protein